MGQIKSFKIDEIVDYTCKDIVANHLIETGCYLIDLTKEQSEWYHWKSGIIAPCYCNCRGLISTVVQRKDIVNFLCDSIKRNFPKADCIAGMATAGIPWASMVGFSLDLPVIYIRKQAKKHGVSKRIEGKVNDEKNIVLIDDLIASGESILDATNVVRDETQTEILGIQSIINWGFAKMFELLGEYQIQTLTSYEQVIMSALRHNLINNNDVKFMLDFYRKPFEYDWREFYEEKDNFRF